MAVPVSIASTSKLLFGSKYRLPIAAAVASAPEDRIFVRAIARGLGIADNLVANEMRRMEEAGLLLQAPREAGQPIVYFRRVPSPYWDCATGLMSIAGTPAMGLQAQLKAGESEFFEVKASVFSSVVHWLRSGEPAKDDRQVMTAALKSIVAFLNGAGGTLFVGAVDAERHHPPESKRLSDLPRVGDFIILGLQDRAFVERDWDAWERRVRDVMQDRISPSPDGFIQVRRAEIGGRTVAAIDVRAGTDAWYFLQEPDAPARFYIRTGASARELVGPDMVRYWASRQRELNTETS